MLDNIERLDCMKTHLDGSHWGLGDWYSEIEEGIQKALRRGKKAVWTTGWYGSKKEIASACITHANGEIQIEVSVSDDLDTEGMGVVTIPHTTSLEKVRQAIQRAWNAAEEDQRENRLYMGFSILHRTKMYSLYIAGKPQGKPHWVMGWVETYLLPMGFGCEWDSPPGDNYHKWGFQGEAKVPREVQEKLEEWANLFACEKVQGQFTYKGWTIKPWEDSIERC